MQQQIEQPKFSDMTGQEVPEIHPQMVREHQQQQDLISQEQAMAELQAQQTQQAQQNPFAMEQYRNVQAPDTPLQFGGGIAESLLNDDEVPKEVKEKFWAVFHKDNTLTFLDEPRKTSKLINFDIMKIDTLNAMPYYDYTFEKELEWGVLRNVFETKLDRALGFKGSNTKNERIMLQSQFQEQRQISENGQGNGMATNSFFKRLLGRR